MHGNDPCTQRQAHPSRSSGRKVNMLEIKTSGARVRRTGANRPVYREYRWYRWPPVLVCTGAYRPGSNALNLNLKKLKILKKIPKNTSRFIESNSVKFFPNLVNLVFFWSLQHQPKKKKKKDRPTH
jgi:hypothetical protein